ncbi:MAG TPA: IS4 family transposase [Longimicrobium sp.]|nr:IS4 family transposase [Longimicrobium sp.]
MGAEWIGAELETLDLGDPRRKERVMRMVGQLCANPGASIPKACGNTADTKAAYRALSSEAVSAEEIRLAHARATVERVRELEHVLVLQDTVVLNFTTCPETQGLGPIGSKGQRGLLAHSGLVVTPEGVPLGIIHQQTWAREEDEGKRNTRRKRLVEEKESFRWLEMVDAVESLMPHEVEVWVAGDREADIFELFAMQRRPGLHLVVRATHERKLAGEEARYLHAAVDSAPVLGEMKVAVPRSRKRKARTAKLEVQACTVTLAPPRNHLGRKDLSPVTVSVVRVREKGTVPGGEEPIEWMLTTTVAVSSLADAVRVVEAYAQRWKVERYHYVLKSGCGIEKLQLGNADRIERALAIYNVVAWRLLYMVYVARVAPDLPCTAVLQEEEWKTLYVVGSAKPRALPPKPPTVREAVRMVAMLGGFLGRKGDGDPGVQSLWTGFRRLMDFTLALQRLRASPELVGNG